MEGSVSGLPVEALSVLSHYTSIEFYIYMESLIYYKGYIKCYNEECQCIKCIISV